MIAAQRLSEILRPHGFELVWEYWLSQQIHLAYCRPSIADGVFEHLRIDATGKRGEAVWCEMVVTPLRAQEFDFKPCPRVDEVLKELAGLGPDRAAVDIETTEAAIEWETRLADIGPAHVRALSEQHAVSMSRSTAGARKAAASYCQLIRDFSDETVLEYLAVQLSSGRAPAKGQTDPFRGLMICQSDLRDAQECAALAIDM